MMRIKELRKQKSIKQLELCKTLGISQGTLSAWETQRWEPDIKSLLKMCEIFDCTADFLLGRTDVNNFSATQDENKLSMCFRGSKTAQHYYLTDAQAQAVAVILQSMHQTKK